MTEIITCHYDFINNRHHIGAIGEILGWLGRHDFVLIHYSRPISNNERYPNLEFVAQRKKNFTKKERQDWLQIQIRPWRFEYNDSNVEEGK